MKNPKLGTIVLYAVLTNESAQTFAAAGHAPVGEATLQTTAYPGGFRAATVLGQAGEAGDGRVSLLVYKVPGDPYRGESDAVVQRLADVPYSAHGTPGTWTYDTHADAERPEAVATELKSALRK